MGVPDEWSARQDREVLRSRRQLRRSQRTASNGLGAMVGVGGVDGSLARWNKQRSSRLGERVLRTPPPLGCVGRGGPGDATTSPGPSYIYASLTKGGLSLGCRTLRPATTPSVRATDRPSSLRPGPVLETLALHRERLRNASLCAYVLRRIFVDRDGM